MSVPSVIFLIAGRGEDNRHCLRQEYLIQTDFSRSVLCIILSTLFSAEIEGSNLNIYSSRTIIQIPIHKLDFRGRGHGNFRGFYELLNTKARDLGPNHSLLLTAGSYVCCSSL